MVADTSQTQIGRQTAHARVLARDLLDLAQGPDDSPIRVAFTNELNIATERNPQQVAQLRATTAAKGRGLRVGPIVITIDRRRTIRSASLLNVTSDGRATRVPLVQALIGDARINREHQPRW